ncbi:NBEAL1 [Cordylochernes scorpioides]|uniref:NBEAL1 n=1 Tax=Cordylochernes scorpioides TaxID=51811 RepID=A0ABY6L9T7_9ARAC|nr:NBEAL1 [Cordylochernes scorpioides]
MLHELNGISDAAKDSEHYSFLVPVLRALLERLWTPLHLSRQLPALPHLSAGPSFFDDFQSYCQAPEWRYFLRKVVRPYQQRYITLKPEEMKEEMSHFWVACLEANMVASHRRGRAQGESKLRFQSQITDVLEEKITEEHARLQDVFQSAKCQNIYVRRRWKVAKLYLTGPRGPWQSRDAQVQHWKLSHYENFCRMRLKMVLNTNFDPHLHASRLRDNQGWLATPGYFRNTRFRSGRELKPHTDWLRPSPQDDTVLLCTDSAGLAPLASKEALPVKVAREALVWEHNDDYLAEEDLQSIFVNSANLEAVDMSNAREKAVVSEDCQLVTLMSVIKGHLEITTSAIYFFDQSPVKEERDRYDFKYGLSQLREVHLRRYNLRRSALEFFLVDQTSFFLNFTPAKRNKVYSRLLSLRPPNLIYTSGLRSPADLMRASGLTAKWINREISNFQYLMCLNTIAGRTYNDLSQYPVFPWVLADYTSQELDLDNPDTFRDFSKPIGVVNPKNIPEVRAKYENFVDITGSIPKFHYGTHYSNSAGVLHYLVRVEPFTSLHVELQSGRFDVADRQFHSVEATWRLLMESPYDVKELIPEFFYLPEFLINENGFDLGKLQGTSDRVDHVKLPPWAESAEDFIYKHRQALESEYVSTNLNHWIDLIFGCKQKGPQAVEALNVFYYVSYEGAVDLDVIQNPLEREATEGMINNFGQTPTQLFKEPHPTRLPQDDALVKMCQEPKPPSIFLLMEKLKASFVEVGGNCMACRSTRYIGGPFHPGHPVTSAMFGLTGDGRYLVCGGHWDNSLQVLSLPRPKLVAHVIRHHGVVTCVGLDPTNGSRLLSGSEDTTCIVWEVSAAGGTMNLRHLHTLYGHDRPLSALALSLSLDLALTASRDGTLNMHSVRDGMFLRTLSPPGSRPRPVTLVSVSDLGYIVVHCSTGSLSSLHVYTVNGRHLCQRDLPSALQGMVTSGEHLVTGAMDGTLALWQTFGVAKAKGGKAPSRHLAITRAAPNMEYKRLLILYSWIRSPYRPVEGRRSLKACQDRILKPRCELVEYSIGNKVEWSELETENSPADTDNAESRTYVITRGLPSEFCARTRQSSNQCLVLGLWSEQTIGGGKLSSSPRAHRVRCPIGRRGMEDNDIRLTDPKDIL